MRNKDKSFKVIDLCNVCVIEEDVAYLEVSYNERLSRLKRKTKKIRISPKRYLEVEYDDDEVVRAIIKNSKTGKYSVAIIPCLPNGVVDLYQLLQTKGIEVKPLDHNIWSHMKYEYRFSIVHMALHDNAVVLIEGSYVKKLIPTNNGKYEDTDIYLKKVKGSFGAYETEYALVDKCYAGETLVASDFAQTFEITNTDFEFDFGKLIFKVKDGMVSVSKIIGGPEERVTFQFKQTRIPDLAIFLDFVLRAESERQLVNSMNKYFIF